ncbi:MAG: hypothetical protein MUP21_14475 [Dehalococcoidia bacterium]|nr:hypothetical protein [Dehalococcoidia bacterium]
MENLNRQYYFRDQVGQKKVLALQENIKLNTLFLAQRCMR